MSYAPALLSVVIPVYNRADTVGRAIQSALDQDYPHIEVIVIDDGSTDNTYQVATAIKHPAVRCIRQKNSGANIARNRGLAEANGAYVALLDSDDVFLPGHLTRSIAYLDRHPDAVVFARIIVDRGEGKTLLKPPRAPYPHEPISEYLSCAAGFIQTSTVVLPAKAARKVRYLDWLPYGQDVDYAIRLEHAGFQLHMIHEPGAVWNDIKNASRISARTDPNIRMKWATEERHLLTDKAYIGFRGWRVAKAYAEHGRVLKGVALWTSAAISGAYAPRHALIVLLQILLANGWYRKTADLQIKHLSKKWRG